MYRMSILAFFSCQEEKLDREKCIRLALIHDMAESIVGDITPHDGVSKEEKHEKEKDAMKTICEIIQETTRQEISDEFYELWEEYETGKTPEAKYVKDLDKFEMILQAFEYENEEKTPGKLEEFFESTRGKFESKTVKKWVSELEKRRNLKLN
eukprot:Sdes_comp19334_c0_seq1m10507